MSIKALLFILFLSISQTVYAGGMIFPIEITNIKTISKKEHQIKFKLLEKVGFHGYPYPLDKCNVVTLNIEFKEWEFYHKINLFFDELFNPILNTKYLNQEMGKLKTHLNKPILMSDVQAFYYSPHDDCQLFGKTIQLQYTTAHINDKSYGVILQPIRHHSRLENKPKDWFIKINILSVLGYNSQKSNLTRQQNDPAHHT